MITVTGDGCKHFLIGVVAQVYYYYYYHYYKCHGLQCCHHIVAGALYKI